MNITEQDFKKCWNAGFSFSYKILQNREDAEDVTQNAIIKLSITEGIVSPTSWIKAVVKHMSFELINSKKRSRKIADQAKVLLPTKNDKVKLQADPTKSYYDVLKSFAESKNKLRFFAKDNNMTYNQARGKIYKVMKDLKADKSSDCDLASDILNYSQSKIVYKVIYRYIECVKNSNFKRLSRYVDDKSVILELDIESYTGCETLKAENNNNVVFYGKSKNGVPVFGRMIIRFNGRKTTIDYIGPVKETKRIDDDTLNQLTDAKMLNGIFINKI